MKLFFILFSVASLLINSISSFGQDWPDWRGINRDAVWNEDGIVDHFELDTIPIKWSVQINPGYSGPTVSNGNVYVTDRIERPVQQERVLCFDEKNGEKKLYFFQSMLDMAQGIL